MISSIPKSPLWNSDEVKSLLTWRGVPKSHEEKKTLKNYWNGRYFRRKQNEKTRSADPSPGPNDKSALSYKRIQQEVEKAVQLILPQTLSALLEQFVPLFVQQQVQRTLSVGTPGTFVPCTPPEPRKDGHEPGD